MSAFVFLTGLHHNNNIYIRGGWFSLDSLAINQTQGSPNASFLVKGVIRASIELSTCWAPPCCVWSNCSLPLRSSCWQCHINQVKNTVRPEKWCCWKQDQRPGNKCQDLLKKLAPKLHNYTFFPPQTLLCCCVPDSFFPFDFSGHLRKHPLALKRLISENASLAFLRVGECRLDWTVRICPAVWNA